MSTTPAEKDARQGGAAGAVRDDDLFAFTDEYNESDLVVAEAQAADIAEPAEETKALVKIESSSMEKKVASATSSTSVSSAVPAADVDKLTVLAKALLVGGEDAKTTMLKALQRYGAHVPAEITDSFEQAMCATRFAVAKEFDDVTARVIARATTTKPASVERKHRHSDEYGQLALVADRDIGFGELVVCERPLLYEAFREDVPNSDEAFFRLCDTIRLACKEEKLSKPRLWMKRHGFFVRHELDDAFFADAIADKNMFDKTRWEIQQAMTATGGEAGGGAASTATPAAVYTPRFSTVDSKTLAAIAARIWRYTKQVMTTGSRRSSGVALYRTFGAVNHSCEPNAIELFLPDGTVGVFATQRIPKGAEVTISYSHSLLTRPIMSINDMHPGNTEHETNSFVCKCNHCRDLAESRSTKKQKQKQSGDDDDDRPTPWQKLVPGTATYGLFETLVPKIDTAVRAGNWHDAVDWILNLFDGLDMALRNPDHFEMLMHGKAGEFKTTDGSSQSSEEYTKCISESLKRASALFTGNLALCMLELLSDKHTAATAAASIEAGAPDSAAVPVAEVKGPDKQSAQDAKSQTRADVAKGADGGATPLQLRRTIAWLMRLRPECVPQRDVRTALVTALAVNACLHEYIMNGYPDKDLLEMTYFRASKTNNSVIALAKNAFVLMEQFALLFGEFATSSRNADVTKYLRDVFSVMVVLNAKNSEFLTIRD